MEITIGRLQVGHVDLHLEVDPEDEALTGLAVDRAEPLVEVVCDRRGVGPVQGQDRGRHDLRGVDAGVDRVLAGAQRGAELGDDHADLAGRHLHPRVLGHREHRPQLEPEPGHEQTGLVAGLALEGDHLVAAEASPQSLVDQPDLAGSDEPERREDDQQQDPEKYRDDERNR